MNEEPVGSGPYRIVEHIVGKSVKLERNPSPWPGSNKAAPKIDKVEIRMIPDRQTQVAEVLSGGMDLIMSVAYDQAQQLKAAPQVAVQSGGTMRIVFLLFNAGADTPAKELLNLKVRQAIAHAIDKEAVAAASLPEGAEIATQFMPDSVVGWSDEVTQYEYDPAKAKALLKEAGADGATIDFNYPTDISRPYMPSPEDTFNVLRSQLEAVGLKINPVADVWSPDYLDRVTGSPDHDLHLLGWTGDYNDSDNFVGVFFGTETAEFGFKNEELFDKLAQARGLPTVEEQTPLYEEINEDVMEFLPGVPIAHPAPTLAFGPDVEGYQQSPVNDEVWNTVSVG
jgi:peptide/nickel transport system substrate-binding protein